MSAKENASAKPNDHKPSVTGSETQTKPETASTRWNNEPESSIRHPRPIQTKKMPKVVIWKDLNVSVPIQATMWRRKGKEMRSVLKNVSGVAEAGQILAIMGESGAGKTTLLNVLTQRHLKALQIEGEVNVNGEVLTPKEMQHTSAYVQQFDLFMGSMTVREHLIFSAYLRMGRGFTNQERMEKVEEVIGKMGLANCQNTIIGQKFTKSISLGEKKRLAFASELLTDPPIMFCDEPTSGLDAFMAKQVILALKKLATDGCTVIITIHQPSSQIFELFDRVCFMGCGQVIYLGPTKRVPAFFSSVGYPMADYTNPAEHAIRCLSVREGENKKKCLERVQKIAQIYADSALAEDYRDRTHGPVSDRRKLNNEDIHHGNQYAASWCTQFWWLFKRSLQKTIRDPLMIKVRLIHTILTAIVVSIVFFQTKLKKETVMSYNGLLFNTLRDSYFMYVSPCILVFTEELPVFLRENHANIYRTDAYFVAKNLAELPQYLFLPFTYSTIVFLTSGILGYDFVRYLHFISVSLAVTFMALSMAYMAACIFGAVEIAVQVMPMITLPMLTFAGFFINLENVPVYFLPFKYMSWFKYSYEAFMITTWNYREEISGCTNVTLSRADEIACVGSNGTQLLQNRQFHTDLYFVWIDISVILGTALFIRGIALLALWLRSRFADA